MTNRKTTKRWKWTASIILSLIAAAGICLLQRQRMPGEVKTTQWIQASFPVAEFQAYTSPFGKRQRPCPTCSQYHKGQDIAAPEGSEMKAWWGGKVIKIGFDQNGWGNYLIVLSGKWEHLYAHGRKILVKEGDTVHTGQIIAEVGQTGGATGPHLHWELRHQSPTKAHITDSSQWDLVNPAEVLWRMYKARYPTSNISLVNFHSKSTPDDAMETY
ncbi:M23 family metallopeptidase [Leptolyngbya sp. AN03gr2]|uniref:M23 family metallopeptidase n=1 Tax=unclassified Leptolyngbya TaxID=2650499 RepID=UPI003D3125ED